IRYIARHKSSRKGDCADLRLSASSAERPSASAAIFGWIQSSRLFFVPRLPSVVLTTSTRTTEQLLRPRQFCVEVLLERSWTLVSSFSLEVKGVVRKDPLSLRSRRKH